MGRSNKRGGTVRLAGINRAGYWPSGNPRCYYRPKGRKGIALPDLPMNHPDFLRRYAELAEQSAPLSATHPTGSLGAAVAAYLASDVYLQLAASSREGRRRICDKIREDYGPLRLSGLMPRHIRKDLARFDPHPANNRLKVWRALGRWWVDRGLLDVDPARDVRPHTPPKSVGHTPWTRDDLEAFRARWSIGTQQRLCMELIYQTAAAIIDVTNMGPGKVKGGWLTYTRQKSQSEATCPMLCEAPDWFESEPYLAECIAAAPRAMTYLTTEDGRSRSHKAASQWFSRACRDAGLTDGKSAHGLRKLRAAMFRENGATQDQRMAILGHETKAEADRYSKSADLRKVITGTTVSNSGPTMVENERKSGA